MEKYRKKLIALEPQILIILDDEQTERQLAKAEQSMSKAERRLAGTQADNRSWFETMKQREDEKSRSSLTDEVDAKNGKPGGSPGGKKRKRPEYGNDGLPVEQPKKKEQRKKPRKFSGLNS